MIHPKRKKLNLKIQDHSPHRLILYVLAAMGGVLLILAAYHTVRKTVARMSADFYFPFLKTARGLENSFADGTLLLQDKRTLAEALLKLRQENFELAAGNVLIQDLKQENEALRRTLTLSPKGSFRPVFAEVLTRDPMSWNEQLILDKGSSSGISEGDPVVVAAQLPGFTRSAAVLLGRVRMVSSHTAVVSTILSQDFKLGVSLAKSRATGILEGEGDTGNLEALIRFLPVKARLHAGELVMTNTFSGNNPPGIPIGELIPADKDHVGIERNHVYQEAKMRLFVNPEAVRFVAVYVRGEK